jgi:hypothetical protein
MVTCPSNTNEPSAGALPTDGITTTKNRRQDMTKFYVIGQDMAPGAVGPFDSMDAAQAHIQFQTERGDAACFNGTTRVVTEEELGEPYTMNVSTPEQDRELI